MAESTVVKTLRDGLIVIGDSGGANEYTVSCEPGDFTYSSPGHAVTRLLDRNEHKTPRRGVAQVTTFGFSVLLTDLGDPTATYATLPDICEWERAGTYVNANWTSTFGTTSDVKAVDVTYTVDGSAFGEADKDVLFDDSSIRGSFTEGDPSTYAVTGEASILVPVLS